MIDIKEEIKKPEYDFLRTEPHLGRNIILLGLGGSHAYGTNTPTSDVDIRGIALNNKRDILLNTRFEQVVNTPTDTTIYSLNKIVSLLSNCNPNTIELLGLREDQYIASKLGKALIANKDMFLSKRACYSFGGYATAQLNRLQNKASIALDEEEYKKHITRSIQGMLNTFPEKYKEYNYNINVYVDSNTDTHIDNDYDIYADVQFSHFPLRNINSILSETINVIRDYDKLGKRNRNAIAHNKLGKHMCHTIRLYYMLFDILENNEIKTYRDNITEHNLLMDLRNEKYLDKDYMPIPEFFDLVEELERRVQYDKENTDLPDNPDYKRINDFLYEVNKNIVSGNIETEPLY